MRPRSYSLPLGDVLGRERRRYPLAEAMIIWTVGATASVWLLGGVAFMTVFRGLDFDNPWPPKYAAGWAVIAVAIGATLVLAWWLRNRIVAVMAALSVPLQIWLYAVVAIPMAVSVPN